EAAEGNVTVGQGGQRSNFDRDVRWREAEIGFGQAPDGLSEVTLFVRRADVGIADQVIHLLDAGRREIAQPGGLYRGGLACEHRQTVVAGMAGKVEQDVYVVGMDQRGDRIVVECVDIL